MVTLRGTTPTKPILLSQDMLLYTRLSFFKTKEFLQLDGHLTPEIRIGRRIFSSLPGGKGTWDNKKTREVRKQEVRTGPSCPPTPRAAQNLKAMLDTKQLQSAYSFCNLRSLTHLSSSQLSLLGSQNKVQNFTHTIARSCSPESMSLLLFYT